MRELDRLCESYGDLLRHLDPAAASAAGFVSGDERLGRFDEAAVREHLAALKATGFAIEQLEIDELADEIDRTALLDDLRATVARFEEDRPHRRDPGFWVDHLALALTSLLLRDPGGAAGADQRARAGAARIAALPAFLDAARATLARPPLLLVDGALARLGGVGQLLVHAAAAFGPAAPDGSAALAGAVGASLESLARFGYWLREEVEPQAEAGGALGEAGFDKRIHSRYAVRAGAGELWRYAGRLLEETTTALAARARALDATREWRDQLARLEEERVPAVAGLEAAFDRVRATLASGGGVAESAPAPVVVPEPLRAGLAEVMYLPSPDPDRARVALPTDRLSRSGLAPIAAAMLAGRHLQARAAQRLERAVRRELRSPIAVQGWSLYAEQWMAEAGLFSEPGEALVREARLLRAAALLAADVGLHARGMSAPDAIALLADRAAFPSGEAQLALRSILAHPTEASAAALGRRELVTLREAAGVRVGDAPAIERFHAGVLSFGALPPGLAAWGMGFAS